MSILRADCPRCGAKAATFDCSAGIATYKEYGWHEHYEVFSVCRLCHRSAVFVLGLTHEAHTELNGGLKNVHFGKADFTLTDYSKVEGYISLKAFVHRRPDRLLPKEIADSFSEGATCLTVGCYNAAGAMFRLCVDLVTKPLLPEPTQKEPVSPTWRQRRDLGLRLQWLFDNNILDGSLRELAKCIREDGNDGAHAGSLTEGEAEDLLDFTERLLDRVVVEPLRLIEAQARRDKRRGK